MKYLRYTDQETSLYFWRTVQQQEIDLIEDHGDKLMAIEMKWNSKKKPRFPLTFTKNYPVTETHHITRNNIEDFIMD